MCVTLGKFGSKNLFAAAPAAAKPTSASTSTPLAKLRLLLAVSAARTLQEQSIHTSCTTSIKPYS